MTAQLQWEQDSPPQMVAGERLAELTKGILVALGEDAARDGLVDTPTRVAKSLEFLTQGYRRTLEEVVGTAVFEENNRELVLVRDIHFHSLCEHHLLPFFGTAHIGYLPNGRVIGLSKLPRIVDLYARRLQVQERLAREIAGGLQAVLAPRGVGVVIEAEHMCMAMRGVQQIGSRTITSCLLGDISTHPTFRSEYLSSLKHR
jgi:GTP cyclohydrolase I